MKCPRETGQEQEMLLAFSSAELDTESAAAFAEHIRSCEACRKEVAAQQAVWNALDEWDAPAVSSDFDRRLYARIENDVPWWRRLLKPVLVRRALPITAAAAAIVAAVLVVRPTVAPPPAAPQSAAVEAVSPDQAENTLQDMETLREFSSILHSDVSEPKM